MPEVRISDRRRLEVISKVLELLERAVPVTSLAMMK